MNANLDFLRPWAAALRDCLEHDAPHSPVLASFCCHPIALDSSRWFLDLECSFTLSFPVNGHKSQYTREALELLTVLAAVNPNAFAEFLAEFMDSEDVSGLFYGRHKVVHPSWEIYLAGKVSTQNPATTEPSVTWGQLFGCPNDPWGYSTEFRAAMDKLKTMGGEEPGWGDLLASIQWTVNHEAVPMTGWQESENKNIPTMDSFSRELSNLFMVKSPPMVQLCAVADGARLVQMWEQFQRESHDLMRDMYTWKSNFASTAIWEITAALAQTSTTSFTIRLDDRDGEGFRLEDGEGRGLYSRRQLGTVAVNAGFLFSTIVCGESVCNLPGEFSAVVRQGKFSQLVIRCEWASDAMLAAICSAAAESTPVELLTFIMGADDSKSDGIQQLTPQRWGWLIYALCSQRSNASDRSLHIGITTFPLTKEYVSVTSAVLKANYPEPVTVLNSVGSSQPPEYGFVDIQEGTQLRPIGLTSNGTDVLVLSQTVRCRTLYDPATMAECINVIVPGYGVCEMDLKAADRVRLFVHDTPKSSRLHLERSKCIRSLDLEISTSKSGGLMKDLLVLIGGGLRTLGLSYRGDGQMSVDLNDMAIACPDLESLRTTSLAVVVSSSGTELRNWGINTLSIDCTGEVVRLPDCLRDPSYRMSRELLELRTTQIGVGREYSETLQAHDKEFLSLTKEKFPARSKAAMLSVVRAAENTIGSRTNLKVIHRLDSHILSLIFTFAAIPEQRLVRVHV